MVVRAVAIAAAVGALVVGAASAESRSPARGRSAACVASTVHYGHHPGVAPGLDRLPWIEGTPRAQRLVGLLWYWPDAWRTEQRASADIYSGGTAPGGKLNMKILWVFLAPHARAVPDTGRVVVKGRRLDAPGKSWQRFVEISYRGQNGAPSYASVIDLPSSGCWRVDLTAGALHGSVVFRAVDPTLPTP
jgi:hypothetical protein